MSRNKALLVSISAVVSLIGVLIAWPGARSPSVEAGAPGPKVTICHIPPNNPANGYGVAPRASTVGERAVAAHLGHGGTLGPCP